MQRNVATLGLSLGVSRYAELNVTVQTFRFYQIAYHGKADTYGISHVGKSRALNPIFYGKTQKKLKKTKNHQNLSASRCFSCEFAVLQSFSMAKVFF